MPVIYNLKWTQIIIGYEINTFATYMCMIHYTSEMRISKLMLWPKYNNINWIYKKTAKLLKKCTSKFAWNFAIKTFAIILATITATSGPPPWIS